MGLEEEFPGASKILSPEDVVRAEECLLDPIHGDGLRKLLAEALAKGSDTAQPVSEPPKQTKAGELYRDVQNAQATHGASLKRWTTEARNIRKSMEKDSTKQD